MRISVSKHGISACLQVFRNEDKPFLFASYSAVIDFARSTDPAVGLAAKLVC